MRQVHKILQEKRFDVLMVEADLGDDFGEMTQRYLHKIKKHNGVLLAVCTQNYAKMTASRFCSYYELRFAYQNHLRIVALKVEDTFPPEPAYGPNHPYDKHGDAQGLVDLAINSSTIFLDCRDKSAAEIAEAIGNRLAPHAAEARSSEESPAKSEEGLEEHMAMAEDEGANV